MSASFFSGVVVFYTCAALSESGIQSRTLECLKEHVVAECVKSGTALFQKINIIVDAPVPARTDSDETHSCQKIVKEALIANIPKGRSAASGSGSPTDHRYYVDMDTVYPTALCPLDNDENDGEELRRRRAMAGLATKVLPLWINLQANNDTVSALRDCAQRPAAEPCCRIIAICIDSEEFSAFFAQLGDVGKKGAQNGDEEDDSLLSDLFFSRNTQKKEKWNARAKALPFVVTHEECCPAFNPSVFPLVLQPHDGSGTCAKEGSRLFPPSSVVFSSDDSGGDERSPQPAYRVSITTLDFLLFSLYFSQWCDVEHFATHTLALHATDGAELLPGRLRSSRTPDSALTAMIEHCVRCTKFPVCDSAIQKEEGNEEDNEEEEGMSARRMMEAVVHYFADDAEVETGAETSLFDDPEGIQEEEEEEDAEKHAQSDARTRRRLGQYKRALVEHADVWQQRGFAVLPGVPLGPQSGACTERFNAVLRFLKARLDALFVEQKRQKLRAADETSQAVEHYQKVLRLSMLSQRLLTHPMPPKGDGKPFLLCHRGAANSPRAASRKWRFSPSQAPCAAMLRSPLVDEALGGRNTDAAPCVCVGELSNAVELMFQCGRLPSPVCDYSTADDVDRVCEAGEGLLLCARQAASNSNDSTPAAMASERYVDWLRELVVATVELHEADVRRLMDQLQTFNADDALPAVPHRDHDDDVATPFGAYSRSVISQSLLQQFWEQVAEAVNAEYLFSLDDNSSVQTTDDDDDNDDDDDEGEEGYGKEKEGQEEEGGAAEIETVEAAQPSNSDVLPSLVAHETQPSHFTDSQRDGVSPVAQTSQVQSPREAMLFDRLVQPLSGAQAMHLYMQSCERRDTTDKGDDAKKSSATAAGAIGAFVPITEHTTRDRNPLNSNWIFFTLYLLTQSAARPPESTPVDEADTRHPPKPLTCYGAALQAWSCARAQYGVAVRYYQNYSETIATTYEVMLDAMKNTVTTAAAAACN